MNTDTMFSSKNQFWCTPQAFFDKLDAEFHFTLDPCATAKSAKCAKFYTPEDNGLIQSWAGEQVFVNPPYGKEIKAWVRKSAVESYDGRATAVMLIPARTDTSYWHDFIFPYATDIRYIRGRLKFTDEDGIPASAGAPFPSAVVVFGGQGMIDSRCANGDRNMTEHIGDVTEMIGSD